MSDYLIVSRHAAAIEFIRRELPEFRTARVLPTATGGDVAGEIVAGNLPLDLAALAQEVFAIVFDGQPPRGQEFTLADMDAAGAHIRRYIVFDRVTFDAALRDAREGIWRAFGSRDG